MNKLIPLVCGTLLCVCATTQTHKEQVSPETTIKHDATDPANDDTSFDVSKYSSVDNKIKQDRETARLAASRPKSVETVDSVKDHYTISLDQNPQALKTIDSLDKQIDSLETQLYKDTKLRKMRTYTTTDKVEYMKYIIKNKVKTSYEVTAIATSVQGILTLERQKIALLMSYQTGNAKAALHGNLSTKDREIQSVANLLSSISEDPDLHIEHTAPKLDP